MARKSKAPTYDEVVNAASVIRNEKFRELVDAAIIRELDGRKLNVSGWCFDGPAVIRVYTLNGSALTYMYINLDCVFDANYHRAKIRNSARLRILTKKCDQYREMISGRSREIDEYKARIAEIGEEYKQVIQEIDQHRTVKLT